MIQSAFDVLVNTFCIDSHFGSKQYLHFFKDKSQLQSRFSSYSVNDEYDHSFIYIENPGLAQVLWKNKAGQIQFCGSGAYALAWIVGGVCQLTLFQIHSEFIKLNSRHYAENTLLEFEAKMPDSSFQFMSRKIYFNMDSGLFFLSLNSPDEIQDDKLLRNYQLYITERFANNVHGFCAFYWSGEEGHLRYFTPWHGRDEDYVTGSIHQNLTPLVHSLYNAEEQTWIQISSSKGQLHSVYLDGKVSIKGECTIESYEALERFLKETNLSQ